MGETRRHRLTLGDLIAEDAFRLELLSGGPDASSRDVRGAHAVEVSSPARWLGPGWVMLTTGVRLRGNAAAQRELVPQLEAGGASALGFGVGLGFKRVPPALVEVARAHEFPVFAVPYETPFREIIHFVDSSLISGEEHLFRRLTALQRYLVDALRTPQPERAMVERLARFLDASVVLMSTQGEREVVAGKPPAAALLDEVCAEPAGLLELDAGGWHAVATPVVSRADRPARWLVLASPRLGFVDKLAKPAAEATAPLLAAMARLGDVVRDQEQAVKAALLKEALEPVEAHDPLPLAARAAAFGIDFSRPARLVVVRRHARRADAPPPLDLHRARRVLVSELEHAQVPHLAYERGEAMTALVQCDDDVLAGALRAVSDALPTAAIGIGRPVDAIADAHHSLHDAELAVDRGGLEGDRRIVRFEDFDLGTFMVSEIPPERLGPKVDEILSVLRANPPLYEALGAYFAHDLDIASTAEALHMHRNSLRYRLARAEHVLGRSLKQPSTIAAVYLALVAEAGVTDGDVRMSKAAQ
ncbi:MAG TPA: PucR family transcriptional regulator ligand-binding domain-containing protein [Solirubrobacteraceae bacterium]|nr:PucR family transcriptional regulator ligand-binding domain-containing protein [Solirubrobacteraceae bacterium]